MNKSDLLAKLLVSYGDIKKYVRLNNCSNGLYFTYAFCDGYPENNDKLPKWASELEIGQIYELTGWCGDHWAINGSQPVNVGKLMNERYNLSVNDINNIINDNI